jgi:hypothetical protein
MIRREIAEEKMGINPKGGDARKRRTKRRRRPD